jgi:hypothetical protein
MIASRLAVNANHARQRVRRRLLPRRRLVGLLEAIAASLLAADLGGIQALPQLLHQMTKVTYLHQCP